MSLVASTNNGDAVSPIKRPHAIFPPDIWGDFFLRYTSEPTEADDNMKQQVGILKEEVKKLFLTSIDQSILQKLKLIDSVQRLGVSYHFEHEIDEALEQIHYSVGSGEFNEGDLHIVALVFRLLRQKGYEISSDVFKKFKNEEGKFDETLTKDVEGLWSLYEASQLRTHADDILDEACDFTYTRLKSLLLANQLSSHSLAAQINRSLNIPIHKRLPRSEAARYYMNAYEDNPSHNEILLTFAKLDFNSLQKMHQKEVGSITKWLKKSNFGTRVPYARERFVEPYLWPLAMSHEPENSTARRCTGKLIACLSLVDDAYDAYGTVEELELFTEAIQRWDISIIEPLPQGMKAVFETVVEICDEIELLTGDSGKSSFVMPRVKQAIYELFQAYLIEAKWCHEGHIPTYDEYRVNGILTSTFPLQLASFIGLGPYATKEVFDWMSSDPDIIQAISVICRFVDDTASHKFEHQRVHVATAVECCIKQYDLSLEEAYELIFKDVEDCWKVLNEEYLKLIKDIPKHVLDYIVNLARITELVYGNFEDKYTNGKLLKNYVRSLLVDPMCIEKHKQEKKLLE
ncbi:hypothetical protein RIF29_05508 [Crotalaria pallida]|uniref:Terpene synthase 2 n=1 Tax=Crotalaria pallida TaxID=3830 RepID=A0AAN9J355_CROPI